MSGLIFHLIPHTHWDREWYLPRAAFQARLVPALDDLLERLQADPGYRSFLLDGQTVLVADYLTARPERETEFKTLVKTGRLQLGPWYVLTDELIPSGEALVRNLQLGAADAERFGGRLDVLYSPDAFGHPAVWPTLAREFGIRAGVVWRGLGGGPGPEGGPYPWRGPPGPGVPLWRLPPAGDGNAAPLPPGARPPPPPPRTPAGAAGGRTFPGGGGPSRSPRSPAAPGGATGVPCSSSHGAPSSGASSTIRSPDARATTLPAPWKRGSRVWKCWREPWCAAACSISCTTTPMSRGST